MCSFNGTAEVVGIVLVLNNVLGLKVESQKFSFKKSFFKCSATSF